MTKHQIEAQQVASDVEAFLRNGGKVTTIPRGISGERTLTQEDARKLIKARSLASQRRSA